MPSAGIFFGWYVVACAFLLLFASFGVAYAFGAFFLPLAETFSATRAEVSAVFAYAAALIFITGAVSGRLADRFGPRKIIVFGSLLIIAGLSGSAAAESLGAVTVWFTLGVGMGVGFVYVPTIGTVQRWFLRRRAFASGLAVTGIGLGTLILPLIAGLLLERLDWRETFQLLAVLVGVLTLPSIVFLESEPARRGLFPDGDSQAPVQPGGDPGGAWLQLLVSRPFVQLYLAQCLMSFVVMLPFVHLVPAAEDLGVPISRAVTLLALVGLGSTLGRLLIGSFADRFGRARTLTALFLGTALSYLIWLTAVGFNELVVFALVYGSLYGGFIALMPALLADYFAGPRLSSIIGLQYTSAAFGSLLGPIAAGYIFDANGSYTWALAGAAAVSLGAALLLATTPVPDRPVAPGASIAS